MFVIVLDFFLIVSCLNCSSLLSLSFLYYSRPFIIVLSSWVCVNVFTYPFLLNIHVTMSHICHSLSWFILTCVIPLIFCLCCFLVPIAYYLLSLLFAVFDVVLTICNSYYLLSLLFVVPIICYIFFTNPWGCYGFCLKSCVVSVICYP